MLISLSITLPQSPYLHREQRLQPTKKFLRDTEETKVISTPALSQTSQNSGEQARHALLREVVILSEEEFVMLTYPVFILCNCKALLGTVHL